MEKFSFDLIDSAGFGYHQVWVERRYLLRLALIPFFLKFGCAVLAYALGFSDDLLRRGLFLLPSVFAEGWVLAQFLRTLVLRERWPIELPQVGDQAALDRVLLRARGIISSILVYVLISLVSTVLGWLAFGLDVTSQEWARIEEGAENSAPPGPLVFIPAILVLLASIWAFRLVWLYIPYVVLMPARLYLARLGGFMASVRLLGLFLVCMVPFNLIGALVVHTLMSPYGEKLSDLPPAIGFVVILISSVVDLLVSLVATAAVAYALRGIIPHHPDALRNPGGDKS